MGQAAGKSVRKERMGEPTWEVAHLFPAQGTWTEGDYLALETNHLVELSNGRLEVLPTPTTTHQRVVIYLYSVLQAFVNAHDLAEVLVAALPVRLWGEKIREPDVVFMLKGHSDRIGEEFWKGADLVMEVVSGTARDRRRDLVVKRKEYAHARIPEYWIVDPREERITVLRLARKRYAVHGEFGRGTTATSRLLPGFGVDVSAALSGKTPPSPLPNGSRKPKRRA
jgi:Uma2 family endonuclease